MSTALTVHVQNVETGAALAGQTVTFTAPGTSKVSATFNGAQNATLNVATNASGDASVYVYLPTGAGDTALINASTSNANGAAYVVFAERANGLATRLNFEETSGTTATDATGHARNGALIGGVTRITNSLSASRGLSLDGVDDYVSVGNLPQEVLLASNAAFSISFWVKPQTFVNGTPVTLLSNATSTGGFNLSMPSSFAGGPPTSLPLRLWSTSSGGTVDGTSSAAVTANRWNLIVLNWSGTQATLYVNGASVLAPTGTMLASGQPLLIGGAVAGQRNLYGLLDEVQVYRGTNLTVSDMQAAYQSTLRATDSDSDGLSDFEEPSYGADVNNPDTDGDGVNDGIEAAAGLKPASAAVNDPTGAFVSLKIYTPLE